eukprot:SM000227S07450  [mRNA]  locus=s227:100119:105650:+ [translate_table: standard]
MLRSASSVPSSSAARRDGTMKLAVSSVYSQSCRACAPERRALRAGATPHSKAGVALGLEAERLRRDGFPPDTERLQQLRGAGLTRAPSPSGRYLASTASSVSAGRGRGDGGEAPQNAAEGGSRSGALPCGDVAGASWREALVRLRNGEGSTDLELAAALPPAQRAAAHELAARLGLSHSRWLFCHCCRRCRLRPPLPVPRMYQRGHWLICRCMAAPGRARSGGSQPRAYQWLSDSPFFGRSQDFVMAWQSDRSPSDRAGRAHPRDALGLSPPDCTAAGSGVVAAAACAAETCCHAWQLLAAEEAASRAAWKAQQEDGAERQSWRQLEAAGWLLHQAAIVEQEACAFGRERWVLADGVGDERRGHVAKFAQRARPGSAVRLAVSDRRGSWQPSSGGPPARVAWCRQGRLCIVFDAPPERAADSNGSERKESPAFGQSNHGSSGSADILLVPDSVTFDRMRSALDALERGPVGMSHLLEVLLGCQPPRPGAWSLLQPQPGACSTDKFLDSQLNEDQRNAVRLCTGRNGSVAVAVVHGPFGTGKTRTLVEVVRQRAASGERVLVCAASNAAVDNLAVALLAADPTLALVRTGAPERVSPALSTHTFECLQLREEAAQLAAALRKDAFAAVTASGKWTRAADGGLRRKEARREANSLFRDARRLEAAAAVTVLRNTKVLLGTLTGFAGPLHDTGRLTRAGEQAKELCSFDCAIIDEASQAITPAILLVLPFLRYSRAKGHAAATPTLLGLPKGADSHKSGGLSATLFEELMARDGGRLGAQPIGCRDENEGARIIASALDSQTRNVHVNGECAGRFSAMLRQQCRMPAELMAFPSAAFYSGALRADSSTRVLAPPASRGSARWLRDSCWLEVIDTAGAGMEEEKVQAFDAGRKLHQAPSKLDSSSTSNAGQAMLTAGAVRELLTDCCLAASEVGVITPYSAQVMVLQAVLAEEVLLGLEVDSVDGFQGCEKEAIVLDCVRSNADGSVGFLADRRRLNVAITRARRKLIVVGDSSTLTSDPLWSTFFEWCMALQQGGNVVYRSYFELPA